MLEEEDGDEDGKEEGNGEVLIQSPHRRAVNETRRQEEKPVKLYSERWECLTEALGSELNSFYFI